MKLKAFVVFVIFILSFHCFGEQFSEKMNFSKDENSLQVHNQSNYEEKVLSNICLSFGYNLDTKFREYFNSYDDGVKNTLGNYFQAKALIDLTEVWFGRYGFSVSIGGEYGFSQKDVSESIREENRIYTIYIPEFCYLYHVNPKLIVGGGIGLTQSWYKNNKITESNPDNGINTLIYSAGFEFPIKMRYEIFKNLSAFSSISPSIRSWIFKTNFVCQFNLGLNMSIPSKRF